MICSFCLSVAACKSDGANQPLTYTVLVAGTFSNQPTPPTGTHTTDTSVESSAGYHDGSK